MTLPKDPNKVEDYKRRLSEFSTKFWSEHNHPFKGKPSHLKGRKIGPRSEEARRNNSEAQKRLKVEQPNRKYGKARTSESRSSGKGNDWVKAVKQRDNYTCQHCGIKENEYKTKTGKVLEVHHIKEWDTYPELRFEVSNGLTLCASCHRKEEIRIRKKVLLEAGFNAGFEVALKLVSEGLTAEDIVSHRLISFEQFERSENERIERLANRLITK